MSYKDEKVLISKFDGNSYDYGYEYVERSDGSHFLRIWGEGCIQREIEYGDIINMCLKEHIEHVIRTLEATEALLPKDSLTQYMIEGAIDELKAIETEDVNNDGNIC